MKTVHGILRKKIENNEPLFNFVTNENISEAVALAKLNGYDNFKIFEQLDRKSCKASLDVRLFAILNNQEMVHDFFNKYLVINNNDVRLGYLVKTFLHLYYRSNGMGGVLGMLHKCDISNIYRYVMEDEFLSQELITLTEVLDTTNETVVCGQLAKLIELHESSK